jgi:hypothetical protein
MNNKFVIQNIKTKKWLQLRNDDVSKLIFVEKFTNAYLFEDSIQAKNFIIRKGLNVENFQLFQLQVFAQPLQWNK